MGGGADRLRGSMLSVWKLMGGTGVILSICWMPAWMAVISFSSPNRSSMALLCPPAGAGPSGKEAALVWTGITGSLGGRGQHRILSVTLFWLKLTLLATTRLGTPVSMFCFASSISFFLSSNTT